MNHIEKARRAADILNGRLTDLMDLAEVPEGSPTDKRANKAIGEIYEVLDMIPRCGRTASLVFDDSPLVFVNPNQDMRYWKTEEGKPALQSTLNGSRRAAALFKARSVMARGAITRKRVATLNSVAAALDEADRS